jgi:hypothetical protein
LPARQKAASFAWFSLLNVLDLTIMVTKGAEPKRAKLSLPPPPRLRWSPPGPEVLDDNNRSVPGCIYDLKVVQQLVTEHGLEIVNDAASEAMLGAGRRPLPSPVWRHRDAVALICALQDDDYINSQWCLTSSKARIDCDAYATEFSRVRGRWAGAEKIYVKFGFSPFTGSSTALICSLHLAER